MSEQRMQIGRRAHSGKPAWGGPVNACYWLEQARLAKGGHAAGAFPLDLVALTVPVVHHNGDVLVHVARLGVAERVEEDSEPGELLRGPEVVPASMERATTESAQQ